jgi:hypothetical protein
MSIAITSDSRDVSPTQANEFSSVLDKSNLAPMQNMKGVAIVVGSLAKLPPIPRNIVPETLGTALRSERNWLNGATGYVPEHAANSFAAAWKAHTNTVNHLTQEPLFKPKQDADNGQSKIIVPHDQAENLIDAAYTRSKNFQDFIPEENK